MSGLAHDDPRKSERRPLDRGAARNDGQTAAKITARTTALLRNAQAVADSLAHRCRVSRRGVA